MNASRCACWFALAPSLYLTQDTSGIEGLIVPIEYAHRRVGIDVDNGCHPHVRGAEGVEQRNNRDRKLMEKNFVVDEHCHFQKTRNWDNSKYLSINVMSAIDIGVGKEPRTGNLEYGRKTIILDRKPNTTSNSHQSQMMELTLLIYHTGSPRGLAPWLTEGSPSLVEETAPQLCQEGSTCCPKTNHK